MSLPQFFEALMLLCFAASWPFSIAKAIRTKVVAGKSPMFMGVIEAGYLAGICYKLTGTCDAVIWLYVLNLLIVGADMALYFRYRGNAPARGAAAPGGVGRRMAAGVGGVGRTGGAAGGFSRVFSASALPARIGGMKRIVRLFGGRARAAALSAAFVLAGSRPGFAADAPAAAWSRTEISPEPGVARVDLRREDPPCDVAMVSLDRAARPDVRLCVRSPGGGLFAARPVPDLARELAAGAPGGGGGLRVLAGTNGDFFDNGAGSPTFGMPLGLVVSGGELLTTGHIKPEVLYADPAETLCERSGPDGRRRLSLDRLVFRGRIRRPGAGGSVVTNEFRLVNPLLAGLDPDPTKQPAELALLTARWTAPLPAPGVRIRARRPGAAEGLLAPLPVRASLDVLGPVEAGDTLSGDPFEGAIVGLGAAAGTARALAAAAGAARPAPSLDAALEGGPGADGAVLEEAIRPWTHPLRGGETVDTHERADYPRTMLGLGPDKVVLFVADGRSDRSRGLPSREAAALLAAEGCTDAVQFDGGGSATLLVGDRIANRPSDGRPRPVANGLFLAAPAPAP